MCFNVFLFHTMNYPKKTGFNLYQSRNCAYIKCSVKAWFFKNSLCIKKMFLRYFRLINFEDIMIVIAVFQD